MKAFVLSISLVFLLAGVCFCQSAPNDVSLCLLQKSVREGEQQTVRVSGVFSTGFEYSLLDDAACPEESTWVDLKLKSRRNEKKLQKHLHNSGKVFLVAEGEFFGPVPPDPSWPQDIRDNYPVGWGWLNCRTMLVVHALIEVKLVPREPEQ